ncbi:MAG: DNA polymerase III subunit delta [Pseudomonadota bacterium]
MVALKGAAIDRFIKRPDPQTPIVLVFGPDQGGVQARTRALAAALAGDDTMARIDLDAASLSDNPALLAEEADSVSMFGSSKVIIVRLDDPKPLAATVASLLETPPTAASIIIAAGDLKKSHPVRKRIESSPAGVGVPCYAPEQRDLARVLEDASRRFAVVIAPDVQKAILGLLGSDYALAVGEIEKLCLACHHTGRVDLEAVEALLTDSVQTGLFDVSDKAFAGDAASALRALEHVIVEGQEPSVVGQILYRQGLLLETLRAQVDSGSNTEAAIRAMRPPIYFKRQPLIARAVSLWSARRLRVCIANLDEEILHVRLDRDLAATRLERLVLRVASMATAA